MGRRALRKVDAELDLSRHLYALEDLKPPFAPESYFAAAAPLEVELGSGKGLFITEAATRRPDVNFVGLEIARKYAAHCAARLARRKLPNGVMISGDGLRFFREFLPDASTAAVHVYFPDPWWKKRHRKRRVMNEALLADVHRVLRPGGVLHFWTDVEEYFTTSLELLARVSPLVGPLPVAERTAEHDLDYHTHFERRKRKDGLPIYRSEFQKS